MTKRSKLSTLAAALVFALGALPAWAIPQSNIVFVGDSITQGGSYLQGPVPSYRYQLFKNYVDNDIRFNPMGMTDGARHNIDVSALTPDYRGNTFTNVSESAASGRSYQYSGHENDPIYRSDPGAVYPISNRGPVMLKLSQVNPFTKSKETFFDGTKLTVYDGETYESRYGKELPETLCIMIGINDLYDDFQPAEKIAEHVRGIVKAYQQYNPQIRVHLFELLPTAADNGTGTNHKNNYAQYNSVLRKAAENWSTATSRVTVDKIDHRFYAEDGSMVDGPRGAHPNAQGELIVAGNIARAIGVGQRTAGLNRVSARDFPLQGEISSAGTTFAIHGFDILEPQGWQAAGENTVRLDTEINGQSKIAAALKADSETSPSPFSLSLTVRMTETSAPEINFVGISCGNESGRAGQLFIGESGIYWNGTQTLLYGSKSIGPEARIFTRNPAKIRIAWKPDSRGENEGGGFYVWLGDQLIGESLQGLDASMIHSSHKNQILIGDFSNELKAEATISELALDTNNAFAPVEEESALIKPNK